MLKRRMVFGGTFDPVHLGHLQAANAVFKTIAPDEFLFLPAGSPPHREQTHATRAQRLHMLELALKPYPWFTISRQELEREGPSWMSYTLSTLRDASPEDALMLVLGQDAANGLDSWHEWQRILDLAHLVIMTRPGEKPAYGRQLADEIEQRTVADLTSLGQRPAGFVLSLPVPPIAVSSTQLRQQAGSPGQLREMVPATVADYIEQHALYGS